MNWSRIGQLFSLWWAIFCMAAGAATVLCLLLHRLVPVVFEWPWSATLLVGALALIVACVAVWRASGGERRRQAAVDRPAEPEPDVRKPDMIYEQLYTEMRRFRDHEKAVVTWYTTILLAMMGALISFSAQTNVQIDDMLKLTLAALIVAVTGSMHYLIWYTSRRYRDLRDYTNEHYDRPPNRPPLDLRNVPLSGHNATVILLWILTFALGCVLLHMPPDASSDSSHMRHPKARSSQCQTLS